MFTKVHANSTKNKLAFVSLFTCLSQIQTPISSSIVLLYPFTGSLPNRCCKDWPNMRLIPQGVFNERLHTWRSRCLRMKANMEYPPPFYIRELSTVERATGLKGSWLHNSCCFSKKTWFLHESDPCSTITSGKRILAFLLVADLHQALVQSGLRWYVPAWENAWKRRRKTLVHRYLFVENSTSATRYCKSEPRLLHNGHGWDKSDSTPYLSIRSSLFMKLNA